MPPENTAAASPATALTPPKSRHATPSANVLARQQRDRLFDEASKGMTPVIGKSKPNDPLQQWLPQIMRKHRQGFSAQQIVTMAKAPGIGLMLSLRGVRRLIATHAKQPAKTK